MRPPDSAPAAIMADPGAGREDANLAAPRPRGGNFRWASRTQRPRLTTQIVKEPPPVPPGPPGGRFSIVPRGAGKGNTPFESFPKLSGKNSRRPRPGRVGQPAAPRPGRKKEKQKLCRPAKFFRFVISCVRKGTYDKCDANAPRSENDQCGRFETNLVVLRPHLSPFWQRTYDVLIVLRPIPPICRFRPDNPYCRFDRPPTNFTHVPTPLTSSSRAYL